MDGGGHQSSAGALSLFVCEGDSAISDLTSPYHWECGYVMAFAQNMLSSTAPASKNGHEILFQIVGCMEKEEQ